MGAANLIEREEALGLIRELMTRLRESLMDALPDFGRHLGYDGKAITSHSARRRQRATGKTSDPTADWGVHFSHPGRNLDDGVLVDARAQNHNYHLSFLSI